MKTISGGVVSSKPISLSKAAKFLLNFVSVENGTSQAVSTYLHRASDAFNELAFLHRDPKTKHEKSRPELNGIVSSLEDALENPKDDEHAFDEQRLGIGDNIVEETKTIKRNDKKKKTKKKKKKKKQESADFFGFDIVGETMEIEVNERKRRRSDDVQDVEIDLADRQSKKKRRKSEGSH